MTTDDVKAVSEILKRFFLGGRIKQTDYFEIMKDIEGLKMNGLKCEECKYYDKNAGGCRYTHFFCLRTWGEDRPSWCPMNKREEEDNEED